MRWVKKVKEIAAAVARQLEAADFSISVSSTGVAVGLTWPASEGG